MEGKRKACCICMVGFLVLVMLPLTAVYVSQCTFGWGSSLHVEVDSVHLSNHPTDNVLFGWEWLFGKPADEISVNIHSGMCSATTHPQDIQEDQTIKFWPALAINTFFGNGFSFRLEESDSGIEGEDDYSDPVHFKSYQLSDIRDAFDEGRVNYVQLSYAVTVKGANIFQENSWFGFIADNLCINVLDLISGPWTGKTIGKALRFGSSEMAKLYRTVKTQYKAGSLTKKSLFKALLTYQAETGTKKAAIMAEREAMNKMVQQWALDETELDKKLNEISTVLKDEGRELKEEIAEYAGVMETVTDTLEFCLSEVWPPSTNALYYVNITISE